MDVLAPIAFAGFVALGWCARRGRNWTRAFLVYAVLLSSAPGLLQLDAWPFSAWPLVAGRMPLRPAFLRPRVVDSSGAEHDVDHRAWRPLMYGELNAWLESRFPALSAAGKREAATHLLGLAEAARRRVRSGGPAAATGAWLGPLAAPPFVLKPARWREPDDVPGHPFVALRLYRESWTLGERLRAQQTVERRLVYEYSR